MRRILLVGAGWLLAAAAAFAQFPMPTMGLPGRDWAIQFETSGLQVDRNEIYFPPTSPDSPARGLSTRGAAGLNLTAFLYPARGLDAKACREQNFEKLRTGDFELGDIRRYEADGKAAVEYTLLAVGGRKMGNAAMRNLWVHVAHDDTCLDLHLSKAGYSQSDAAAFRRLFESVAVVATKPDVQDLVQTASALYLEQRYQPAARFYQQALNLEREHPTLPRTMFIVVVDNLGMSYGLSGDLAHAQEIFEYGVAREPEYPMFHYNLACTLAENGDLGKALQSLRLAFKYRANQLPGEEGMPDPRHDDSFRRYVGDPQFERTVKELMGEQKQ
ncbi:MAG: hypothetical protein ACM3OB_02640 [Acidobacteriota bacterium]